MYFPERVVEIIFHGEVTPSDQRQLVTKPHPTLAIKGTAAVVLLSIYELSWSELFIFI